jgi:hypothetical protein
VCPSSAICSSTSSLRYQTTSFVAGVCPMYSAPQDTRAVHDCRIVNQLNVSLPMSNM